MGVPKPYNFCLAIFMLPLAGNTAKVLHEIIFLCQSLTLTIHTHKLTQTRTQTQSHTHKYTRRICTYPYLSLASRAKHTQHTRTGRESHTHTHRQLASTHTFTVAVCVCDDNGFVGGWWLNRWIRGDGVPQEEKGWTISKILYPKFVSLTFFPWWQFRFIV